MQEQVPKLQRQDPLRLIMKKQPPMVTDAYVYASEKISLEPDAIKQLYNAACLPPVRHILATPDIHVGFGVPIGCVMAMENAIMPPAVGYDINCGMSMLKTSFFKDQINLDAVSKTLARNIPLGEGKTNLHLSKKNFESTIIGGVPSIHDLSKKSNHYAFNNFDEAQFQLDLQHIEEQGKMAADLNAVPQIAIERGVSQLGTLGGGNHFVEIQYVDQIFDKNLARQFDLSENQITIMIHSGSRRFGYEIADHYMNAAANQPYCSDLSKMLAYIKTETRDGQNYISAMHAAANFGFINRYLMTLIVRECFNEVFGHTEIKLIYDIAHNIAKLENYQNKPFWVHRKGATRAFGPKRMKNTVFAETGQPVITPGSMGTASFLLAATDNSEQSLCSVNHGAGRVMSRSAAIGKRKNSKIITPPAITDDQFKRSMKGIELIAADKSKIKEEAPQAYKNIDHVVEIIAGCKWAIPVAKMRPLVVLKG
ncbi:MAG TPA: RtcB family protein [Sedimentisphaerales bacterium]|nr:RtcB family protein [Sedimentisphaerales bacterium]